MITILTILLSILAAIVAVAFFAFAVTVGVILFKRRQWAKKKYAESTGGNEPAEGAEEEGNGETLLPVIPGTVSLDRVDAFIFSVRNFVPKYKIEALKLELMRVPAEKFTDVSMTHLKNPTTVLLLSIFFGLFGIDRFYMGDVKKALLKWFLGWTTLGIWPIVDIFVCNNDVRELNWNTLMENARKAREEDAPIAEGDTSSTPN